MRIGDFIVLTKGGGWEWNLEAIRDAPEGLIEGIEHDKATGAPRLKFVSPLAANVALLNRLQKAGEGSNENEGIWKAILEVIPAEQLKAIYLNILANGGGRGAGPES